MSSKDAASFPDRLRTLRELMGTIDRVTRSGQEHAMHRVLGILRREIVPDGLPLTDLQLIAVTGALAELEDEAGRPSPAPDVFNDRARLVVEVLSQGWSARPGRSSGRVAGPPASGDGPRLRRQLGSYAVS